MTFNRTKEIIQQMDKGKHRERERDKERERERERKNMLRLASTSNSVHFFNISWHSAWYWLLFQLPTLSAMWQWSLWQLWLRQRFLGHLWHTNRIICRRVESLKLSQLSRKAGGGSQYPCPAFIKLALVYETAKPRQVIWRQPPG